MFIHIIHVGAAFTSKNLTDEKGQKATEASVAPQQPFTHARGSLFYEKTMFFVPYGPFRLSMVLLFARFLNPTMMMSQERSRRLQQSFLSDDM